MKLMSHKLHGYAHAYSEQDEQQMKANGWVEKVSVVIEVKPEQPQVNLEVQEIKKRGRPAKAKG